MGDTTVSIGAGGAGAGAFAADAYYSAGDTHHFANTIDTSLLTVAVPPGAVLQDERYGEFTYTIPNRTPGSAQTVTLYFQEGVWTGPRNRSFDVGINGSRVLTALDIFASTGGMYRAMARTFDTTADASGNVVIQFFRTGTNNPQVSALTVAPGTFARHTLTVTKADTGRGAVFGTGVDCGPVCSASYPGDSTVTLTASAATGSTFAGWVGACTGTSPSCTVSMGGDRTVTAMFTGGAGDRAVSINANGGSTGTFDADTCFSGGTGFTGTNTIDRSLLSGEVPPDSVFQTERWGNFTYTIPNRTANSAQRVILYFVESVMPAAGRRTFDVAINGTKVLTEFDIFAAAGGANRAIARSFDTIASSSGQVVIEFVNGANDHAKVNGLTVVGR